MQTYFNLFCVRKSSRWVMQLQSEGEETALSAKYSNLIKLNTRNWWWQAMANGKPNSIYFAFGQSKCRLSRSQTLRIVITSDTVIRPFHPFASRRMKISSLFYLCVFLSTNAIKSNFCRTSKNYFINLTAWTVALAYTQRARDAISFSVIIILVQQHILRTI